MFERHRVKYPPDHGAAALRAVSERELASISFLLNQASDVGFRQNLDIINFLYK